MGKLVHLAAYQSEKGRIISDQPSKHPKQVFFTKEEFRLILATYSYQIGKGNWKDYAIDSSPNEACFSIFRHSYENSLFKIIKRRNGKYWEFNLQSPHRIVKRSRKIQTILNLLKDPLKLV